MIQDCETAKNNKSQEARFVKYFCVLSRDGLRNPIGGIAQEVFSLVDLSDFFFSARGRGRGSRGRRAVGGSVFFFLMDILGGGVLPGGGGGAGRVSAGNFFCGGG